MKHIETKFAAEDKDYFLVMIRPVGSHCWTMETLSSQPEVAAHQAAALRGVPIEFADGSLHPVSTAIVQAHLPSEVDTVPRHYPAAWPARVFESMPIQSAMSCQLPPAAKQAALAEGLVRLSREMESVASQMCAAELADPVWTQHHTELLGAAYIAREWAGEIEKGVQTAEARHE